MLFIVSDLAKI